MPYEFAPMSSRERRIVHLALRDQADLRTESQGEGGRRCLVVYPKDYKARSEDPPPATKNVHVSCIERYNLPVNLDDTIVAIATPPGRGGIGVIRLAGPEARALRFPCCG